MLKPNKKRLTQEKKDLIITKKTSNTSYKKYSKFYAKYEKDMIIKEITTAPVRSKRVATVSKRLNIPRNTLNYWVKQSLIGVKVKRGKYRKIGGGRKSVLKLEDEKKLYNWLMNKRALGAPVTPKIFLSHTKKETSFFGGRSWLSGFFNRWELSLRKGNLITPFKIIQETSLHASISNLWKKMNEVRLNFNVSLNNIINLDEVPVWFDCAGNLVIDKKAKKRVGIRTNSRDKLRITVILAVCANGTKLTPLVIFRSLGKSNFLKNKLIEKYKGELIFAANPSAYSNTELFYDYLHELFPTTEEHKILLMDSSNTHGYVQSKMRIVGKIKQFLDKRNIHVGIIPEHTTGIIQPLDTHINKSFKSHLKHLWSEYMCNNIDSLASNGKVINSQSEARFILSNNILESFNLIRKETIIQSFKETGHTLNLDGSEEGVARIYWKKY